MRSLKALGRQCADLGSSAATTAIEAWAEAQPVGPAERAIAVLAGRLTLAPNRMTASHLTQARAAGLDERAAYDVVTVTACFAFMNRLADGTGVTLLPERHDLATELFGASALAHHLRWGAGIER